MEANQNDLFMQTICITTRNELLLLPDGSENEFIGTKVEITESGYKRTLSRYQAQNCNCPLRGKCHKSKETEL